MHDRIHRSFGFLWSIFLHILLDYRIWSSHNTTLGSLRLKKIVLTVLMFSGTKFKQTMHTEPVEGAGKIDAIVLGRLCDLVAPQGLVLRLTMRIRK